MWREMKCRVVHGWLCAIALPAWGCSSGQGMAATLPGAAGGSGFQIGDASTDGDAGIVYEVPPIWSGNDATLIGSGIEAVSLAVDGTNVYWQDPGGAVYACPLAGCPGHKPTQVSGVIGPSSGTLENLTANGGVAVFLSNLGTAITSVRATGGSQPVATYDAPDAGGTLSALIGDATNVYFINSANDETISSCPRSGSCTSPRTLYSTSNDSLGPLAVAGSDVYFVDLGDSNTIRVVPTTGGSDRVVCSSELLNQVVALHVASGYVYFTTAADNRAIYQCATSGVASPSLYIVDLLPYALADDGENLYWTNYVGPSGTVATCGLGAVCLTPHTVAEKQDGPFAIAANASGVYWGTATSVSGATK